VAIDTAQRFTSDSRAAARVVPHHARFRRRSLAADLLVASCWASAAIAVALFLAAGGTSLFTDAASLTTSLGIVAGLIGTDLVLIMLVLAARLPFIDRTVGHDRAMATHRSLGQPALYLLLSHGVLLLIGYGISAGFNPIAEIAQIWAIPDMPLAFIGLGLLVLVVVTSLVAVRRKLPYEVWHVIHLLSYAAVIVALPHQLSVGGMLSSGPARVYWIALYAAALGSIGIFRFIVPILRSLRHGIQVSGVEVIAPGVFSIHMRGRDLRALRSAGGQFFIWRFWTGSTWWHSHPISLSAAPTNSAARITVRELGKGTGRLSALPVGTRVSIEGPYGLFTDAARTSPKLAIVAAGIGIAPIRALLEQAKLAPGEATVLLRGSTEGQLYLLSEIEAIAGWNATTRVYTSVGARGQNGRSWLAARDGDRGVSLRSIFPDLLQSDLYVCGPLPWTSLVEAEALAVGMPAHQIHYERFDL
jgi:predicted ferric reductase